MSTKTRAPRGDADKGAGRGGGGPTALITFLFGAAIVAYLFFTNPDPKSFEAYNYINTGLCLWAPLMVILFVLRQEPNQFGLTRGDQRFGLKWALIAWIAMILPLIVYYTYWHGVRQYYLEGRLSFWAVSGIGTVFHDGNRVNLKALLYYELEMGFYMFCWEFFFRGFLLFGLQKSRLGAWGAVIVQALLFMLLHWSLDAHASKPSLEVLSALPGGIILGWFALRTRTFLYGYLVHWAISVTLDVFLLAPFIFHRFG